MVWIKIAKSVELSFPRFQHGKAFTVSCHLSMAEQTIWYVPRGG
jgi:hypothetical protein